MFEWVGVGWGGGSGEVIGEGGEGGGSSGMDDCRKILR